MLDRDHMISPSASGTSLKCVDTTGIDRVLFDAFGEGRRGSE